MSIKRLTIGIAIILAVFISCTGCAKTPDDAIEVTFEGFYQDDGSEVTEKSEVFAADSQVYKFTFDNGDSRPLKISDNEDTIFRDPTSVAAEDGAYVMQNRLKVGQKYSVKIQDDTIVKLETIQQTQDVSNGIISYTPGERTLKNFLKTAMAPMGTLMVVGGGWDLQDVGAGNEARTIGVDSVWKDEYTEQTVNYDWRNTYPHNGWNKDHFRGFDASGYLGWVLYNTMYDTSLSHPGLVLPPNELVRVLTQEYNFGDAVDLTGMTPEQIAQDLRPGDIVALDQHLYIVVGACDDGSIVTVQCATAMSKSGVYGGGVQLAVFNPKDDLNTSCEAFRLVDQYMKDICPQWAERYDTAIKMNKYYLAVTGIARMNLTEGMFTDPDGYASMNATEILADIF